MSTHLIRFGRLIIVCLFSLFLGLGNSFAQENTLTIKTSIEVGEVLEAFNLRVKDKLTVEGAELIPHSNQSGLKKGVYQFSLKLTNPEKVIKLKGEDLSSITIYFNRFDAPITELSAKDCSKLEKFNFRSKFLEKLDLSGCSSLKECDLTTIGSSEDVEAFALESIDVSGCTALENLWIEKSRLTELNISSCENLKSLISRHNKGISAMDISNNHKLDELVCPDNNISQVKFPTGEDHLGTINLENNDLDALEVPELDRLIILACSGNRIKTLDLSKHPDLVQLSCSDNQLTSLDVSHIMYMEDLDCGNNQLTELKLSPVARYRNIDCRKNKIKKLIKFHSEYLKTFIALTNELEEVDLSNAPELLSLYVYNNKLKSLDISKSTKLSQCAFSENMIESLKLPESMDEVEELYVHTNKLKEFKLPSTKNLKKLYISNNLLTKLDISNSPALSKLSAEDNQLTGIDVSQNKELIKLYIDGNKISNLDLSQNANLKEITIVGNSLKQAAMQRIVEDLPKTEDAYIDLFMQPLSAETVNDIYKETVSLAKSKGWAVNFVNKDWDEFAYEGNSEKKFYKISIDESQNGAIEILNNLNNGYFDKGDKVLIKASTNEGYKLKSLKINDFELADKEEKSFLVEQDSKIKAVFEKKTFAVTTLVEGEGELSLTGADDLNKVAYGTEIFVQANAKDGYELTSLTANGKDIMATKKFTVKEANEVKAVFVKTTAIDSLAKSTLKYYPNPAQDFVFIEGLGAKEELKLYSMNGVVVMTAKADELGRVRLNLSQVPNGLYIIQARTQSIKLEVKR